MWLSPPLVEQCVLHLVLDDRSAVHVWIGGHDGVLGWSGAAGAGASCTALAFLTDTTSMNAAKSSSGGTIVDLRFYIVAALAARLVWPRRSLDQASPASCPDEANRDEAV